MEYKHIPGTHMKVCPIVLGTDYYGKTIPEETACRLMDTFFKQGGNMIDTAHVYSDYLPGEKHMSEKVIGRWLKSSGLEKEIYIATKGGFPEIGNMHASRLSYKEVKSDMEESLECLQTDSIDLYWLHRDNTEIPVEEIVQWMNEFLKEGKIKSYGFSNWTAQRLDAACEYARKNGITAPCASQIRWSLAVTEKETREDDTLVEMDSTEYKWYEKNNFPVFAFSSQAKGFFAKLKKSGEEYIKPEGKAGIRYFNGTNLERYEKLITVCGKYGITVMQGALAWILYASFPAFPIIGCKNTVQLEDSMKAANLSSSLQCDFSFK